MLFGIREVEHELWTTDGAPWDYGIELLRENAEHIGREPTLGFECCPVLWIAGARNWVDRAFAFPPDGNPLVGPMPGAPGH